MEEYTPNTEVLERMKQVRFVAFVGPTAAGKSTLIREIINADPIFSMVRSTTSRPPRPSEASKGEFAFRSREEMQARITNKEYVQVAPIVLDHLYATAPEDYSTKGIALMPVVSAAIPAFRKIPFESFCVVYVLPPNDAVWQERIVKHGFDQQHLQKRMQEAARSLQFALCESNVRFVINDSLADATIRCTRIAQGIPLDEHYEARARKLAEELSNNVKFVY